MARKKNVDDEISIAVMANDIATIKDSVKDIKQKLDKDYVTVDQFDPVRKIVYGLVALILIAVVGGLLALIIKK